MKTHLQKLIGTAVLGLALFTTSLPTWAGQVNQLQVTVSSGFASGSMVGARNSGDSQQYIGCEVINNGTFVICQAADKTGKPSACASNDLRYVQALKAVTDSSFLYFSWNPSFAPCTSLLVSNNSLFR